MTELPCTDCKYFDGVRGCWNPAVLVISIDLALSEVGGCDGGKLRELSWRGWLRQVWRDRYRRAKK